METLQSIDVQLFHFFNTTIANPVLDFIMPLITNQNHILPLYAIALILLFWKGGRTGRIVGITMIITAILSDQLSSNFLKNLVGRLRPCHELVDVRLLINCGGGKSFPSSHAVNNFAVAMVLAWNYKKYAWVFFGIAAAIAFSRVYCGVHYPLDITAGAIIGTLLAYCVLHIRQRLSFAKI